MANFRSRKMRVGIVVCACPTISIRNYYNPNFIIDSYFEKDYTLSIEVTPICAYILDIYGVVDETRVDNRVFFYSLKKGDIYNGFWTDRQDRKGETVC